MTKVKLCSSSDGHVVPLCARGWEVRGVFVGVHDLPAVHPRTLDRCIKLVHFLAHAAEIDLHSIFSNCLTIDSII